MTSLRLNSHASVSDAYGGIVAILTKIVMVRKIFVIYVLWYTNECVLL